MAAIQRCFTVTADSGLIIWTYKKQIQNSEFEICSIPVLPQYSASRNIFVKHFRGVAAIANIRGGGEYGEHWYFSLPVFFYF